MSKQFSISSGEQANSAIINANACYLSGVMAITDGTNDAKVILYDGLDANGTVKGEFTVIGNQHFGGRDWARPVHCANGIYANISGTGATYIVEYCPAE